MPTDVSTHLNMSTKSKHPVSEKDIDICVNPVQVLQQLYTNNAFTLTL